MKKRGFNFRKAISMFIAVAMVASITVFEIPNTASAATVVYIASTNSPQTYIDQANANASAGNGFVCANGAMTSELRNKISAGNATFQFAPGSYLLQSVYLTIGNNSIFKGVTPIVQPVNVKTVLYPDPTKMAVFETRGTVDQNIEEATRIGMIMTKSLGTNIQISDIAMSGYVVMKLQDAKDTVVRNVLVHNYSGIYPNGQWCNMGYNGATASLWLSGSCNNVQLIDCQVQFSSHHGIAFQSGDTPVSGDINTAHVSRNCLLDGVRALYCGNGMLAGETASVIQQSKTILPERDGHGYLDWSVAFDLCENQSIENVTVQDCYALSGWKCGFYTEPQETGGRIVNLSFIRCRSDDAGQRTYVKTVGTQRYVAPRETENANYFTQGAYFEDCISVNAEKCGWLIMSTRAPANPKGAPFYTQLKNCIDMGSPVGIVSEMFGSNNIGCDGFISLNPQKAALWLFGTSNLKFTNTKVLANTNTTTPVVRSGGMVRQGFLESLNVGQLYQTTSMGKYGKLRAHLLNSEVSGTVYNMPSTVNPCEIIPDSTFNSYGPPAVNLPEAKISLTRQTGTINAADYVNDNWGRSKYTVSFNSTGGTAVAAKTAYAENTITAPATPKKTAYTFTGWYTASSGGTLIKWPYTVTKNVTLYARWKVATPLAPKGVSATRTASKTIRVKWYAATKVAGYSVYRATSAYGTYKRIANTKYLTYTNKYLTKGKYYYYKIKSYRMSGTTKIYSGYSSRVRAKA